MPNVIVPVYNSAFLLIEAMQFSFVYFLHMLCQKPYLLVHVWCPCNRPEHAHYVACSYCMNYVSAIPYEHGAVLM